MPRVPHGAGREAAEEVPSSSNCGSVQPPRTECEVARLRLVAILGPADDQLVLQLAVA